MTKETKIALVCANGGHLTEMLCLKEAYEKHRTFFVTYRGSDTQEMQNAYYYTDYKSVMLKMLIQLATSWYILLKERPKVLISTGGAIAIPISIYAKLLRIHIIYIDCGTKVYERSGTGKFMIHLANLFLTQWPDMVRKYGRNAKCWGSLI